MHRFSEFAEEYLKLKISEIIDKECTFLKYEILDSKFIKPNNSKCVKLYFTINEKKYIAYTGSKILQSQCEQYKDQFPFIAIIKKGKNNRLTFS